MKGHKREQWKKSHFLDAQKKVKGFLEEYSGTSNPKGRLSVILHAVKELEEDGSSAGQLRRYIFVMSALAHHLRHGGLTDGNVSRLAALAKAILLAQGVTPTSSKLAFLYGDLHQILSQMAGKAGRHWEAAWGQQMAEFYSRRTFRAESGDMELSRAIRCIRLGHLSLGLAALREAEKQGVSEGLTSRLWLERVKALRLSGDLAAAMDGVAKARELPLSKAFKLELEWERLCAAATRAGDIGPLLRAVTPKGSHSEDDYGIDAFLWSRSVADQGGMERYPTMRRLCGKAMSVKQYGVYLRFAQLLEQCYDYQVPFPVRLEKLEKHLLQVNELLSPDKRLLVWVALARWLARSRNYNLAALILSNYQALSLQLSQGGQGDVLGVAQDMLNSDWYRQRSESQGPVSDSKQVA